MAGADRIRVLIGSSDSQFLDQARALSDRVEVLSPADLDERPELLGEIEVVYGGLSRERMGRATGLKWLQTAGAGVNGLITPEMAASDLVITNASGIHAEPITEHMFGMVLMLTRRMAQAWDQQKAHDWSAGAVSKDLPLLAGKTLGVLGVGAIGGHGARVGQGFGMRVIGCRRTDQPHPHVERMYSMEQRLDFFRECDVVMNSLPLTEKTRHLMSWEEFAALKPGAIVINTGRGGTIHTDALMGALREGRLGGACLDVTDPEPLPAEHPLWDMENVLITPHYSGSHATYSERAGRIFLENLRRYIGGEPMINVVDKAEGY